MSGRQTTSPASEERQSHILVLTFSSLLAGAAAGLIGALFRLALVEADRFRNSAIVSFQSHGPLGFLAILATCALTIALAAWLVRRFSPEASGSGIPHVEAVLVGEVPPAGAKLILIKFLGGLLAIGSGLALGREGPTVQMGATVSHVLGNVLRLGKSDTRALLAAGAGAGLATAFNAPIAGGVFVLEELVRRFDTRITIATFGASTGAISVARLLIGDRPEFEIPQIPFPSNLAVAAALVLGVLLGALGVAYNRTLLGSLAVAEHFPKCPVVVRAAVIGAALGLLVWFFPFLVGGGDHLTQLALNLETVAVGLPLALLIRFFLGAVSYAAATPGGLFAPLLVLGAQGGLIFGNLCQAWLPAGSINPETFVVIGMAAMFTAVVRAPVTGIILIVEMTGGYTQLLPMIAACLAAMVVATLLHDPPIYDSLKSLAVRREKEEEG